MYGIPILKIRRIFDRLFLIMEILILVRRHFILRWPLDIITNNFAIKINTSKELLNIRILNHTNVWIPIINTDLRSCNGNPYTYLYLERQSLHWAGYIFSFAKEFGKSYLNAIIAMEPSEVSLLWFLWYMKGCGYFKRSWEVKNGGQVGILITMTS